jgi:tetratricopeptide (TPR) repeat protein
VSKRLFAFVCLIGLLASACSLRSPGLSEGNLAETTIRAKKGGGSSENDVVYLLLSAELAGQRSQYDVALTNYLKAAEISRNPKIAARATQIALYLKDTARAVTAANLWKDIEPTSTEALRISAMLELQAGHVDAAVEQLKTLLTRPEVDVENTLVEVVKMLENTGSKEDGVSLLRQLIGKFPDRAELHFALALFASEKDEFQLALKETETALALHPDWNRARLLQAQVMSRMGDSDKARDIIRRAVKADPKNLRLRLIYSQFLAKSGDFKAAEKELNQILVKDPGNEDARFGLGNALMETGQREKARQHFLKLTESARWKMQSYFYLGLIEASKGRMSEALQWFEKVSDGPLAFDAQVNAITALINLGDLREGRRRLASVREKFPNEALRLYLLEAELLTKNKDFTSAFDLLTEGLEQMPGQVELLYTRALIAEQLDRIESLEADLRAVLEKNPDDANALNALGYTLADRYPDRLQEAKKYLDKAIDLKPDDPAILDSYGWLSYRMGDYQTAVKYLRRAYEVVKDSEIGGHLGEVLWESGNHQEAKKIWKESFRKNPEGEDARRVRARYPEAFAK